MTKLIDQVGTGARGEYLDAEESRTKYEYVFL